MCPLLAYAAAAPVVDTTATAVIAASARLISSATTDQRRGDAGGPPGRSAAAGVVLAERRLGGLQLSAQQFRLLLDDRAARLHRLDEGIAHDLLVDMLREGADGTRAQRHRLRDPAAAALCFDRPAAVGKPQRDGERLR